MTDQEALQIAGILAIEEDDPIGAFAYNFGRIAESMINVRTDNLEDRNKKLELLILSFRVKYSDLLIEATDLPSSITMEKMVEFDKHFGIIKDTILENYHIL